LSHYAIADDVYDGSNSSTSTSYMDGQDFENPLNWDASAHSPPTTGFPSSTTTATIGAATNFVGTADGTLTINAHAIPDEVTAVGGGAVQGAVFDPVGFGGGDAASVTLATLYVSSTSGQIGSSAQSNLLTINSGTMEVTASTAVIVARSITAEISQTGGTFYEDGTMQLGQSQSSDIGTGIYSWDGGSLNAGISSAGVDNTGSSEGIRMGNVAGAAAGTGLGILKIYNPAVSSSSNQINLENLYLGYTSGGIGVLDYFYGNGNVSTINIDPTNTSEGQLTFRNYAVSPSYSTNSIGSVLNLDLTSAPNVTLVGSEYVPQNLALATYTDGIHGNGTNDKDLFSPSGTDLTEGSLITESFGGYSYTWQLEYDGSISGGYNYTSPDTQISSSNILGTGGEAGLGVETQGDGALVLIGVGSSLPVPEPAAMGLLVLGGVTMLSKRRHRRTES
jgi:hypothetical protein